MDDFPRNEPSPLKVRDVKLMIDHLAFIRGIGNVKRWFNPEYITTTSPTHLTLYIPLYTLHEFDYAKRGTLMQATNAREAIRFVDYLFEHDEDLDNHLVKYSLAIEGPREGGPQWSTCLKYKVHSPCVGEFPNFKTKFDSTFLGRADDDITYENSAPYQAAVARAEELAEMPPRLRYLIRLCIHKRFVEKVDGEPFKLVTEDPITKIWAQLFGIECVNVNEAELWINGYDATKVYDPRTGADEPVPQILHLTIDTTQYQYTLAKKYLKQKVSNRTIRRPTRRGTGAHGEEVQREQFGVINYAPRGEGVLWEP